MTKPTIERIEKVMVKVGMTFFKAPYDVTLGGIRTKDNKSNKFNDWLFINYFDDNGNQHYHIVEGTTDAGLYYRLNPLSIDGTAIIQHSIQHKSCYQLQNPKVDKMRGHKGRKAFRQIANMTYWRDANRDAYLDFTGDTIVGNFLTNVHYMGTLGNNVNKWSGGCQGATEYNMNLLYEMAEVQINNGLGNTFSYALLHELDF